MENLAGTATGFGASGDAAAESLHGMIELSGQMEQSISVAALRSFTQLAKIDHLVFKFDVYKVLMGLSSKQAADLADHTYCRLGKWYYEGEGRVCFSRLDGYAAMENPHAAVHRQGKEAISFYRTGKLDEAVRALGQMEVASLDVLHCLERMAADGANNPAVLCVEE